MTEYEPEKILQALEQTIEAEERDQPEPMRGDPWLLASALQKCIRRGERERTASAAIALWQMDRRRFWTRLHIIALEDVGAGSPDVLVKVLTAVAASAWRRRMGDDRVGLYLARLLSGATKSRLCDAVYIQAERAADYGNLREQLAKANDKTLTASVADQKSPLVERALAAWYLAGQKRFPSDVLPPRMGSTDQAIAALRATNTPADLTGACVGVIRRIPYPLALHLPLIWEEVQSHPVYVRHDAIPIAPGVDGLPVCAADTFTRVGKSCFRQFQKTVPDLRVFTTQQIGLGVFYTDGGRVDKELAAPGLDAIQRAGEIADIQSAGLTIAAYDELQQILRNSMKTLTEIRQVQLRCHLSGGA